ncbi:MAG: DUF1722 domain-containing protein [Desulfobacteraceae bacterium]|nr:DUF1722 domain-containing protein [Desulfobacteraceae bacterium]
MRIWDIQPGYLNRQSLLGEHRELHAMVSIIVNRKKGYARHPETLRWRGYGWALRQRHRILGEEMALRGYRDQSPVRLRSKAGLWPEDFLDPPEQQFHLLAEKYRTRCAGRIPLPQTTRQLWGHHKYSIMARDPGAYREIGRRAGRCTNRENFAALAGQFVEISRRPPSAGGIHNTLLHMWEHVSGYHCPRGSTPAAEWSLQRLLQETRRLAWRHSEPVLMASTALSELGAWL